MLFCVVCGVLPMVIATGAGAKSQQALGTTVMGGMIAVVVLALLMVPVFFVAVTKFFSKNERDGEAKPEKGSKLERLIGMFRRTQSSAS